MKQPLSKSLQMLNCGTERFEMPLANATIRQLVLSLLGLTHINDAFTRKIDNGLKMIIGF
jgi:hypothetical protein